MVTAMIEEEKERFNLRNVFHGNKMFLGICVASILVAAGIFVLLINGYINKYYSDYEVIQETQRQDSNTEQYLWRDGNLIKYSKDGISEVSISGKTIWTGSYEMSNPQVVTCGDYVLVADIGGKDAYIFNGEDTGTELSVDYEIKQADVSKQGLVALLLEDTSSDVINIYNPYAVSSELLVEIPTNVSDGYPVCMAISPDGTSVVASYICVTSGTAESRVAFYNFSEVGKNSDCLVGAKNYQDSLVTDIKFLSNNQVCLFGDAGFYIWKNMKQPKQVQKKKVKKEIKSVFYNEKYIGMVLNTGNKKHPYEMDIYNIKGSQVTSFSFSYEYDHIELDGSEILFYSSKECGIFRLNGVLRFHKNVEDGVSYFFPAPGHNRYYLLNDRTMQEIKLQSK
jgi:hypothetical protein